MVEYLKDYPGWYLRVGYVLRLDGVSRNNTPGFELLRRAIMIQKVYGKLPINIFLKLLYEGEIMVPINKGLKGNRDSAIQCMIETLEVAEIIPMDHDEEADEWLWLYIKSVTERLYKGDG